MFTWNNYPDNWERIVKDKIKAYCDKKNIRCLYITVGKEVGKECGTPHLHGFVTFDKAVSRPAQNFFQAHWEKPRNVNHAITYCQKDGDFIEHGERPAKAGSQGKRSELEDFTEAVEKSFEEGVLYTPKMARKYFPEVAAKYPKFVIDTIQDYKPKRVPEPWPLRPWQQELNRELNLPADRRTIHFIVDRTGNQGKSWFSMYYRSLHDDVQIISPGKFENMAYLLREDCRVFFVDLPRESLEYFPYKFLEKVKDGYVASHKYVPFEKEWNHFCHVIVMMNQMPELSKFSQDRIKITEL